MNMLNKLLLAIAAITIASGPALAKTVDQNPDPGTLALDVADSHPASRDSNQLSFLDILHLRLGPDHNMGKVAVDSASKSPTVLIPGTNAGGVRGTPGRTDTHKRGEFLFSVAAIPEPADWMTLLCGFVVLAFMARRRTSADAD